MRYVVIGAGAIGGAIGGRWFEAGRDVVLVARGEHGAILRRDGLRLATPDGSRTLPIPTVSGPDELELRRDDVLVCAVKSQDTHGALDPWARKPVAGGGVAGARLPVVCAQNGVANERLAQRWFRHVYGMCVWLPATFLKPGVVQAEGSPKTAVLTVGAYPRGRDNRSEEVADDMATERLFVSATDDVMRWKYGKLLRNLGNGFDALFGRDGGWQDLLARAVDEGTAVFDAAGIGYTSRDEEATLPRGDAQAKPVEGRGRIGHSSWQSLARGTGSIEVDYLNGEIVLLGRRSGVPTPVNEAVQHAARRIADERQQPGTFARQELEALIDEFAAP